jgi:glycerophosphoryl diester phosphodiesterase
MKKHGLNVIKLALASVSLSAVSCAVGDQPATQGHDENVSSSQDQLFFGLFPRPFKWLRQPKINTQLGPRPYYLVDNMDESKLKEKLESCSEGPFKPSDFSIGHRGACLQFPEHTKESYEAAARMGAGIIECDVAFTKDRELVCRHDQCDLHQTTDILTRPELAAKCTRPFTPADPATGKPADALCCTSDITLAEFKSLCGKMDGKNDKGTTVTEYLDATANWRTDLYSTCGTLVSHAESIELIDSWDRKFTPELKTPPPGLMPFEGEYTQEMYAQQMIDEYKERGISPKRVWVQSFRRDDVLYWLENEPAFGKQAVYLDSRVDTPAGYDEAVDGMDEVAAQGINIIAPPMWALVTVKNGKIVPSDYAKAAKGAGLDIITWTLERSGLLVGGGGYYYQSVTPVINNDGDAFVMLDVLAKKVGVLGVFSDWPATTTYYANCMGL